MPVGVKPASPMLVVFNAVSAASTTKSPAFMPSANILTNGFVNNLAILNRTVVNATHLVN